MRPKRLMPRISPDSRTSSTKNATYNPGFGPNVYEIDAIQASVAEILVPEVITQVNVNTESITLLPPFDEQGAAGTATSVIYVPTIFIG